MKIIIEGPQGCGKTRLANALALSLTMNPNSPTIVVIDEEATSTYPGARGTSGKITIITTTPMKPSRASR